MVYAIQCAALGAVLAAAAAARNPPHILFIVADDLGFNDVSAHGSQQIPTPNIDAIAASGVRLDDYYVQPVCSPSRATFLSGRHVIHTGIFMPFSEGTSERLNLSYSLLPQYLKNCCNYSTHLVGKWHLGQNVVAALPVSRGFDTEIGYLGGAEGYYNHTPDVARIAYDFLDANASASVAVDVGAPAAPSLVPAVEYNGSYSADVFVSRAKDIIASFGRSARESGGAAAQPMFMYLAFQNVHWPLEAPEVYVQRFVNTTGGDMTRALVCAMVAALDDAVGNVTQALRDAGMYDDTVIVFTGDNGGDTHGDEGSESNNFPLRGGKNTLWQGGVRVFGAMTGPGVFVPPNHINTGRLHATDWLPTLVSMAAGEDWHNFIPAQEPPYLLGDGLNAWPMLSNSSAPSPRTWVLLETHGAGVAQRVHGDALIAGDWKLIKWAQVMPQIENGWFAPPGQAPNTTYTVKCGPPPARVDPNACSTNWCLFNITADPCEYDDVSAAHPDVVAAMQAQLDTFQATAVPQDTGHGCLPSTYKLPGGGQTWWPCDAAPPAGGVLVQHA